MKKLQIDFKVGDIVKLTMPIAHLKDKVGQVVEIQNKPYRQYGVAVPKDCMTYCAAYEEMKRVTIGELDAYLNANPLGHKLLGAVAIGPIVDKPGETQFGFKHPVDMVNHPPHYNQGNVECIDAIESAVIGLEGIEAHCIGTAIKYLWRWKFKGGAEDLKKAIFYLNRVIDKNTTQNEKT